MFVCLRSIGGGIVRFGLPAGQQGALAMLNSDTFAALNKNPVSALMEYAQSRKLTATIEVVGSHGPPHNPRSVSALCVDVMTQNNGLMAD